MQVVFLPMASGRWSRWPCLKSVARFDPGRL